MKLAQPCSIALLMFLCACLRFNKKTAETKQSSLSSSSFILVNERFLKPTEFLKTTPHNKPQESMFEFLDRPADKPGEEEVITRNQFNQMAKVNGFWKIQPQNPDGADKEVISRVEDFNRSNVKQILVIDTFRTLVLHESNQQKSLVLLTLNSRKEGYQATEIDPEMRDILLNEPLSWKSLYPDQDHKPGLALIWKKKVLACEFEKAKMEDLTSKDPLRCLAVSIKETNLGWRIGPELNVFYDGVTLMIREDNSSDAIKIAPKEGSVVSVDVNFNPRIAPLKVELRLLIYSYKSQLYKIETYRMSLGAAKSNVFPPIAQADLASARFFYGPEFEFNGITVDHWHNSALSKCKLLKDVTCTSSKNRAALIYVHLSQGLSFEIDAVKDDVDVEVRISPLTLTESQSARNIVQALVFDIPGMRPAQCGGTHLNTSVKLQNTASQLALYRRFFAEYYRHPAYFSGVLRRSSSFTLGVDIYLSLFDKFDLFFQSASNEKYVPLRYVNPSSSQEAHLERFELRASRTVVSAEDWIERIAFVEEKLWKKALSTENVEFNFSALRELLLNKTQDFNFEGNDLIQKASELELTERLYPTLFAAMKNDTCPFSK
jgi:hypothetical protein